MFAGHIGAALAIARVERRINIGALVFSALLLDVVLWLFILFGWESVTIPENFAATHQPEFVFPYSHGLLAAAAWSLLAGIAAFLCYPQHSGAARLRAAAAAGTAVFSHWLLDALVHAPELPLVDEASTKIGLGLWHNMPIALVAEALVVMAGLWLFVAGANLSPVRKVWFLILVLGATAFTVAGMTVAPAPPSATAMAASSLATIVMVCALIGWLGKQGT